MKTNKQFSLFIYFDYFCKKTSLFNIYKMISSQSVAFLQYLNLILGGSRIFQGVSVCVCVCVWVGGGGAGT